jgi:hypothetical protein
MSTDLFQAVVVSIVVVGNRIVLVLRLVRIYGDVVLPVTLLELLNILADLHKDALHSPQQHAIQPFDMQPTMRLLTSVAVRRRRC